MRNHVSKKAQGTAWRKGHLVAQFSFYSLSENVGKGGGEAKGGVDPQYVWGGIPWTIILECCSGLSRLLLTPFALDMGVSAVTAHAAAACRVISMAEG